MQADILLLNKELNVEVCDATGDATGTHAGLQKNKKQTTNHKQ